MTQCLHQRGFIFRQEDLGAVRQDQHILFPPGDVELALLVKTAEVAGVEDAVVQHGARRVGALVVALHHAGRRLDQDLAVLGNRDRVVGADLHGIGVALHGDGDAGARLGQSVAEADADAHRAGRPEQRRRAVARADEHKLELRIDTPLLDKEAQQQRHDGNGRRPVEIAVIEIMPRPAAERDAGAAAKAPEKTADEAEHVSERQHAQQRVLRREGQLGRAVVGALAQAVVRQHDGLGPLGRAGGEEQDLSFSVLHAGHQGKGKLVAQLLVAPEQVDVGIAHQTFEHVRGQRGVKQDDLQPGKRRGEDLDHVVKTAVAEKADAAFAPRAQLFGAFADGLVERAEGERRLFIAQRGGVGGRQREMGEQMVKAVKSHGAPPCFLFSQYTTSLAARKASYQRIWLLFPFPL